MELPSIFIILLLLATVQIKAKDDSDYGVLYPTDCEVCKYYATELEVRLKETGKTHDVIETGYGLDAIKKKKPYKVSELRLIESMEEVCERMLEYNIHKERKDSTRFAKGMSETFRTLHGLVDKGVKVELGIPHELWDKPSVEITTLKSKCEHLSEEYESDIEDWYFHHQNEIPLKTFLCIQRVLHKGDTGCLVEDLPDKSSENGKEKGETSAPKETRKSKKKKSASKEEL